MVTWIISLVSLTIKWNQKKFLESAWCASRKLHILPKLYVPWREESGLILRFSVRTFISQTRSEQYFSLDNHGRECIELKEGILWWYIRKTTSKCVIMAILSCLSILLSILTLKSLLIKNNFFFFIYIIFRRTTASSAGNSLCSECTLSARRCFLGHFHWFAECAIPVVWHRHHARTTTPVAAQNWHFSTQHSLESSQYKTTSDPCNHHRVSIECSLAFKKCYLLSFQHPLKATLLLREFSLG